MARWRALLHLGLAIGMGCVGASVARAEEPPAYITMWGGCCSGPGQFDYPDGLCVDNTGGIYVVSTEDQRIERFSNGGVFLGEFGSFGIGPGQFGNPVDCAVASDGTTYVTDGAHGEISIFDADHAFVTRWPAGARGWVALNADGSRIYSTHSDSMFVRQTSDGLVLARWRYTETGLGSLSFGFAVATNGDVYVSANTYFIRRYSSAGVLLGQWGGQGTADGKFAKAMACALDSQGNVYVCDGGGRVEEFSSTGTFLTKWGSSGTGPGQFAMGGLWDIAVDASNNVYVLDRENFRVEKFGQAPTPVLHHTWAQLKQLYR